MLSLEEADMEIEVTRGVRLGSSGAQGEILELIA